MAINWELAGNNENGMIYHIKPGNKSTIALKPCEEYEPDDKLEVQEITSGNKYISCSFMNETLTCTEKSSTAETMSSPEDSSGVCVHIGVLIALGAIIMILILAIVLQILFRKRNKNSR